jgi:hypothetical protein
MSYNMYVCVCMGPTMGGGGLNTLPIWQFLVANDTENEDFL